MQIEEIPVVSDQFQKIRTTTWLGTINLQESSEKQAFQILSDIYWNNSVSFITGYYTENISNDDDKAAEEEKSGGILKYFIQLETHQYESFLKKLQPIPTILQKAESGLNPWPCAKCFKQNSSSSKQEKANRLWQFGQQRTSSSSKKCTCYQSKDINKREMNLVGFKGKSTQQRTAAEYAQMTKVDLEQLTSNEYLKAMKVLQFTQKTIGTTFQGFRKSIWLFGEPGVGKSRYAKSFNPYTRQYNSKWWDGYQQQKHVLIDDVGPNAFEKNFNFDFAQELKDLGDQFGKLENKQVKNSTVTLNYEFLWITSHHHPAELIDDDDLLLAVQRRFSIFQCFGGFYEEQQLLLSLQQDTANQQAQQQQQPTRYKFCIPPEQFESYIERGCILTKLPELPPQKVFQQHQQQEQQEQQASIMSSNNTLDRKKQEPPTHWKQYQTTAMIKNLQKKKKIFKQQPYQNYQYWKKKRRYAANQLTYGRDDYSYDDDEEMFSDHIDYDDAY